MFPRLSELQIIPPGISYCKIAADRHTGWVPYFAVYTNFFNKLVLCLTLQPRFNIEFWSNRKSNPV